MSRVVKSLSRIFAKSQMVRIERASLARGWVDGYVVGVSDDFVLMHILDPNLYLNGYSVLRVGDIADIHILNSAESFMDRALKLRGIEPVLQPGIDLTGLPALLESANQHYPLITLHCENLDENICYIGRIRKMAEKKLVLEEINPCAQWERVRCYKFKDITRVDFGGGYESALALVAEHEASIARQIG
jgi:hypothetical protein